MAKVEKLSISLPKEMVEDIRYAVDSGQYATTSEVVREAVRAWKGKQREIPERVRVPKTREEFLARIKAAQDSLDRGEGIPAEQVFDRLEKKYAAMAKAQQAKKRRR
jgi:antitoxin ParD1/3/4